MKLLYNNSDRYLSKGGLEREINVSTKSTKKNKTFFAKKNRRFGIHEIMSRTGFS